jgi:hypothetical protein
MISPARPLQPGSMNMPTTSVAVRSLIFQAPAGPAQRLTAARVLQARAAKESGHDQ